jgi:hypothetical protein
MTTATRSTRRRAATMAARYLTPEQIRAIADAQNRTTTRPTARKAPARKAAPVLTMDERQQKMVGKSATIGQMEAINGYHKTLGLRTFDSLPEFRTIVGDMADASILRASLKAQING